MSAYKPFDLAIVFDENVRPEYQAGIIAKIAADNPMLECTNPAGDRVILLNNVDPEAIARAQRDIQSAAVGLHTTFRPVSSSSMNLGFLMNLKHGAESGTRMVANQLVVTGPAKVPSRDAALV